jgi:predicted naringenin-chalcone synthase
MDPIEFYQKTSFEERNDIYVREVIDLGEKVLQNIVQTPEARRFRLHNHGQLYRYWRFLH